MRDPNSCQNGHNRTDSHSLKYEKWQDIPVDVLREFAAALRLKYTDRGLSEMVGLSVGTVQDFENGSTQPERRTLKAFGELYIERIPLSVELAMEVWKTLPQLKSVLPEGEKAALKAIDEMILAAEAAGMPRETAQKVHMWMRLLVQAEYEIEAPYEHLLRKRRPKGSGDTPPKGTRKKKGPDADPEK